MPMVAMLSEVRATKGNKSANHAMMLFHKNAECHASHPNHEPDNPHNHPLNATANPTSKATLLPLTADILVAAP